MASNANKGPRSQSGRQLAALMGARYPLVAVISPEEGRVRAEMLRFAARRKEEFPVYLWSITKGIYRIAPDGNGEQSVKEDIKDPLDALCYIFDKQEDGIFMLQDFQHYLTDPAVLRKLRDLHGALRSFDAARRAVVLICAQLKVPPDLEKELTLLHFDLPSKEELEHEISLLQHRLEKVKNEDGSPRFKLDIPSQRIAEAAAGLTLTELEEVLALSLAKTAGFSLKVIMGEKKTIIAKSGLLEYFEPDTGMSDVGGMDMMKDWLKQREAAFFSEEAKAFGLPTPRGIVVLGPPGTGKSLVCKSVANAWSLPLIRLDMGKIYGGIVGESEGNIRSAIQTAEAVAPCVLWLDEIEKGMSGTGSSDRSDGGTTARVFASFLNWMQEKKAPVFVAATANNVSQLPPELLRKGRFDEIFFVDLPAASERKEIWEIHIAKKKRDPKDFDLDKLVALTSSFTGAEIEQAVVGSMYAAFADKDADDIEDKHIIQELNRTIPLATTMVEDIKWLRDWAKKRARCASSAEVDTLELTRNGTASSRLADVDVMEDDDEEVAPLT